MPRYGFNFQWMFIWKPGRHERALDFMAAGAAIHIGEFGCFNRRVSA